MALRGEVDGESFGFLFGEPWDDAAGEIPDTESLEDDSAHASGVEISIGALVVESRYDWDSHDVGIEREFRRVLCLWRRGEQTRVIPIHTNPETRERRIRRRVKRGVQRRARLLRPVPT